MPGTSHEFEMRIFDGLPQKLTDAAREVLNQATLSDMITYLDQGPSAALTASYPNLNKQDWDTLMRKVCFAKVTYVELNQRFEPKYIYFLFDLLAECLDCKIGSDTDRLPNCIPNNYRHTIDWVNQARIILRAYENSGR